VNTAPGDPPPRRPARAASRILVFALLLAVFWAANQAAERQIAGASVGIDDANIYLRYARNLANGFGCVWNPGGERVEGCTSPAWVALCTLGFAVSRTPEHGLILLSVVLAALGSWIVALRLARVLDPDAGATATIAAGLGSAAWAASSPPVCVWLTTTLMDVALWSVAIILAWSAAVSWAGSRRRPAAFGLALALLALARPEGPAVAFLLLGAAAIGAWRSAGGPRPAARAAVLPAAILAVAVAALFVGRQLYFGQWLPNTYYAKVDASLAYRFEHGLAYLAAFVHGHAVACGAAALGALLVLLFSRSAAALLALVLLAFGAFNVAFVGGDHFADWRVLAPYWPLLLVPVAAPLRLLGSPGWRAAAAAAAAVGVSSATLAMGPVGWDRLVNAPSLPMNFALGSGGRALGAAFNELFPAGRRPVVGIYVAGGFGFAYDGVTFDVLGLNDVEMAHASRTRRSWLHGHGAFHAPTFFRRAPDLFLAHVAGVPADSPSPPPARVPFSQLTPEEERRFDELYAPVAIGTNATYAAFGLMMPAWARRDWLAANPSPNVREIVRNGEAWTYR
jgi:hypothetical protein